MGHARRVPDWQARSRSAPVLLARHASLPRRLARPAGGPHRHRGADPAVPGLSWPPRRPGGHCPARASPRASRTPRRPARPRVHPLAPRRGLPSSTKLREKPPEDRRPADSGTTRVLAAIGSAWSQGRVGVTPSPASCDGARRAGVAKSYNFAQFLVHLKAVAASAGRSAQAIWSWSTRRGVPAGEVACRNVCSVPG